ncbi:acyltransferase, partial [Enterococcus faecium]|nr:acyltransferase [Enterococcus faecium]
NLSQNVVHSDSDLILHNSSVLIDKEPYLANVFVFQVLLLLFKDSWLQLPSGVMILVAYLMTASCAFALSWLLHIIWVAIKKGFSK